MESTVLSMSLTILLFFGYEIGLNLSNGQESGAEERNPGEIITEIRSLLNQTIIEYQNKNSSGASALVEEAYLENYEFIEGAQMSNSFIILMALNESKEPLSTTQISEKIAINSKGKLFKVSGALKDSLEHRLRKAGYVD